jgi:hypothetical protein
MPSPHDILFPDDPDRVARWRREAEEHEREFARQRAPEHVQQSKVQTMDSDTQSKWDTWADNRIEVAWRRHMDVVGDALGETMQKFDAKIAKVRQEMRDSPPLFQAPDKKLSAAMVRVGEEIHLLQNAVVTTHTSLATFATEADVSQLRHQLGAKLGALERASEVTANNVRGVNDM